MKKFIPLCIFLFGLMACGHTPEEKAQKLIKQYVKENIGNPSSYESVSFGGLDTAYMYSFEGDVLVKEPDGWEMTHKYRAKNEFGALVIFDQYFLLDENLMSVTDSGDEE